MATGVAAVAGATSICDKYTTALLSANTAANQATVLTLIVNTALIGNYTNPAGPAKNAVAGILAPGTINGTAVDLLQYFNGSLMSTNDNGQPKSVNFLDGGGAAPLMNNTAAVNTTSNQYTLVTHLYQIFGSLLGCSMQNATTPLKSYQGNPSMSEVHRFMNLDKYEMAYFIEQVGLSATSFGVTTEDATAVGTALTNAFDYRCLPPTSLGGGAANASQSICVAANCPLAASSNCTVTATSFPNGTNGVEAATAPATTTTSSSSGTKTGSDGASTLIINAVGALSLALAGVVAVGL
ncbi:hypothetical protein CBS101457_001421 [Exobasidium rhododendri]|nr:hypothetical protein CBS101457_001421 [Exobasidium rhododendri]